MTLTVTLPMKTNIPTKKFAAIILAAGKGTRMKSSVPKVMHKVAGLAMLGHAMAVAKNAGVTQTIIVCAPSQDDVRHLATSLDEKAVTVVQEKQLGTGDAVRSALPALLRSASLGKKNISRVIVMFGDTPLMRPAIIAALLNEKAKLAVLGFTTNEPQGYGRIRLEKGRPIEIIEHKDASKTQRQITLCNGGAMAIDCDILPDLLAALSNDNAQGEYYLPDLVALAHAGGHSTALIEVDASDTLGVDSRVGLAKAEALYQGRLRQKFMQEGVTLIDPQTNFFSHDTQIENDVTIEPNCFFGEKVTIARGSLIKAFSHIENTIIGARGQIGPYARLRPGTHLEADVRIGNFVETKKAHIKSGAKVNHLSYIGDAHIGKNANIGAGTITCNYDGFNKHKTQIGDGAFIGSNSSLIAPVTIAAGAYVGSSSVITGDVEADALVVTRAPMQLIKNWATKFRARNAKKSATKNPAKNPAKKYAPTAPTTKKPKERN